MREDPGESVAAVDLARLKARSDWGAADGARARAECAATRAGHLAVEMAPDEVPRCGHCGGTLSPDALRRAGVKGRKA